MLNFIRSDYLKTLVKEETNKNNKDSLDSIIEKVVEPNNKEDKSLEKIALISYLNS